MSPQNSKIENQTFVGANVQIDGGVVYAKCKFVKCNLVVTGLAPAQVLECEFQECRWSFAGPATNVFSFLKAIYQTGGKEMVETIFQDIRGLPAGSLNWNPASKSGGTIQ
jgi:hypothetical protein